MRLQAYSLKIKGGFRAAFFSIIASFALIGRAAPIYADHIDIAEVQQRALAAKLDMSPRWAALLHLSGQEPQIKDKNFILTLDNFSARNELLATIELLLDPKYQGSVCKYPARYEWLKNELALPDLPTPQCHELNEFMTRAPATAMSLVFASENLSQPSSMMGHLFLKLSGAGTSGQHLEHAISFFTETDTINLPKLFYDSMVEGKRGYFLLTPYQQELNQYLVKEERSLWEYELKLTPSELLLLRLHMLELKHAQITYFFQKFNCATLVEQILAIAAPTIQDHGAWWTTPKSVIQHAQDAQLISSVTVRTPSRWLVRNIQDILPSPAVHDIKTRVDEQRMTDWRYEPSEDSAKQDFLKLSLARAYNNYRYERREVSLDKWKHVDSDIEIAANRYAGLNLETDLSRDPSRATKEKQVSAGWQHRSGRDLLKLGLLPVSHTLADDNTQYNSENELRLFDSALLIDSRSGRVSLDHLTIYATQSMLPRDPFTGGLSGRLRIGFELQPDTALQERTAFLMEGALGATWRPSSDIDAFVLLGGGWGYRHRGYVYAKPTAGVLIREVYNMKSIITISQTSRPLGESGQALELGLTQSKYLDAQNTLMLEAQRTRRLGQSANKLTVSLKHLF